MAQDALQLQKNTTGPTPVSQVNASASPPIPQQTNITLRPITPSEYLASKIPHQGGITWGFHDAVNGHVRHVNVPYFYPGMQQMNHQATSQPAATNQMILYNSSSDQNPQYALQMQNNQPVNAMLTWPASATRPVTAQTLAMQPSASPQGPSATAGHADATSSSSESWSRFDNWDNQGDERSVWIEAKETILDVQDSVPSCIWSDSVPTQVQNTWFHQVFRARGCFHSWTCQQIHNSMWRSG